MSSWCFSSQAILLNFQTFYHFNQALRSSLRRSVALETKERTLYYKLIYILKIGFGYDKMVSMVTRQHNNNNTKY